MKQSEVARLLAFVSAADSRQVTEDREAVWAATLDPRVTLPDAIAAVTAHYASSTEWLMPAHVNDAVLRIRRKRLQDAGTHSDPAPYPDELPTDYAKRLLEHRTAIADGAPVPPILSPAGPMPALPSGMRSLAATLGPVKAELARRREQHLADERSEDDRRRQQLEDLAERFPAMTEPEPEPAPEPEEATA